jgi:hypothetical protein
MIFKFTDHSLFYFYHEAIDMEQGDSFDLQLG